MDRIIDAFLSGDVRARQALICFTTFPCTSVMGLGGPPKCWDAGVPDGTPVEYLPMMGPGEGMPVLKDEIQSQPGTWLGDEVEGLYAASRVPEDDNEDVDWPAGEYAVSFLSKGGPYIIELRIEQGWIVRYDSGFPPDVHRVEGASWLLPPPGWHE